ncbi:MAG: adenine deaminase [Syntrophomonadaceae bacterium]
MSYENIDFARIRQVARGQEEADLLFVNGQVACVYSGELLNTAVAVKNGRIVGLGDYQQGKEIVDLEGACLLPGFIDSHVHIESSMLTPASFAEAALPHGTTAVLADPHEIVNVMGIDGWRYMVEASRGLPLDFFWQIPSCVPATHLETSGGRIGPAEIDQARELFPECTALAEMMNFPGVVYGLPPVLEVIQKAHQRGLLVEGHAPGLSGWDLNAYLASGCSSDHECTTAEEALEKLRLGMRILIREGSAARNLDDLLPIVTPLNSHRCCFCSDDRHPADLLQDGHMDQILRRAVKAGLPAMQAIQMTTLNPAQHHRLHQHGAIAPGCLADLVVVNNLKDFQVQKVFKQGKLVARDGQYLVPPGEIKEQIPTCPIQLPELKGRLRLQPRQQANYIKVIEAVPGQVLTRKVVMPADEALSDQGINRLAVVERHGINGNTAVGLVKGFDLERGALASSVAHDSHNLIIVGQDEKSMERAAQVVAEMGGGMAAVDGETVLASLALPVAGLMSPCPAGEVAAGYEVLENAARELGCRLPSPFMTMSFLALPVIPELRLTDRGVVDVNAFDLVDIWD